MLISIPELVGYLCEQFTAQSSIEIDAHQHSRAGGLFVRGSTSGSICK